MLGRDLVAIVAPCRVVLFGEGIGLRRLAGRVDLACNDACDRGAARLAAEQRIEQPLDRFEPRHRDDRTAGEHDDRVVVSRCDRLDQRVVAAGHIDRRAVVTFRLKLFGETGKDDRDVRLLRLFDRLGGQGVIHLVHALDVTLRIFRFVAERAQRVPGVVKFDRVDDARTCALIARLLCELTYDGDRLVL